MSYIYNRALSLPPGTDLVLSTSERLNAPSNVRLEEFGSKNGESPRFMLYVDQSNKWLAISIIGGVIAVVLLSLPESKPKPIKKEKDFLIEELGMDFNNKEATNNKMATPRKPSD
jgi:hypothetical protein